MDYEDVAGPPVEQVLCACPEEGPDGHMDLVLKFKTQELVAALGQTTSGEERMLVLTGKLFQHDPSLLPTPIVGNGCVVIRGRRETLPRIFWDDDGSWAE
jgi:hypothetical protein